MNVLDSASFLSKLIESGADAEGHLFQVSFTNPLFTNDEVMMIRADDVAIPELSTGTTDIPIFNTNVKKLSNGIALDRSLSISFRLDINYTVYYTLFNGLKLADDGSVRDNTTEYTITIRAYKPSSNSPNLIEAAAWEFSKAKIFKLQGLSYSRSSSPLKVTAQFIYNKVKVIKP